MGALYEKWKLGFSLGSQFRKKVFANKSLWGWSAFVGIFVLLFRELSGPTTSCVTNPLRLLNIWNLLNILTFSMFNYFFSLVLFFYAYELWKNESLTSGFNPPSVWRSIKLSFSRIKNAIFWIFVFLPLPQIMSGFAVPVIAHPRETVRKSLLAFWFLIKRFWMVAFGFIAYVLALGLLFMPIFIVVLHIAYTNRPVDIVPAYSIVSADSIVFPFWFAIFKNSFILIFGSLFMAMGSFFYVYIYEESQN